MSAVIETKQVEVPAITRTEVEVVAYVCDGCGKRYDTANMYNIYLPGEWVTITVEAGNKYEEGWQIIKRDFCDDCAPTELEKLANIGWKNHFHGSTNLLEDIECPGTENRELCPTPDKGMYDDD